MTERKFTPPTEFPAEYVTGGGQKVVILGRGPNEKSPFIGYNCYGDAFGWTEHGEYYLAEVSPYDLHDIPKRITAWHNVYDNWIGPQCYSRSKADIAATDGRLCVYRIERDKDGGNPEIFVEEME